MRIITGTAKGCTLDTLPGLATRPTSDRVKEAVFSMIQFDIEGRNVLDLFAGSGQLGLEALSRGAKHAVFLDISPQAAETVRKNAEKTRLSGKCTVFTGDYSTFFRTGRNKFDLVFLDPPYSSDFIPRALKALDSNGFLNSGALAVCESDSQDPCPDSGGCGFEVLKNARYGRTFITLLIYRGKEKEKT
ncbi:MAG: 16S rRNA (guanine(966)-N(2))-methyltransferase RsmD [Clostridia bacterium]|nr:16S rRNA (guanine(966)-N(2))-methyltransferase RsmD [Clostridia bacterium]